MFKVEFRCYDPYYNDGSGRVSIEGYVYKCSFDEEVVYTGCYASEDIPVEVLADLTYINFMIREAAEEWCTIPLANIELVCQEDFAKKIGFDKFPWEESSWGSRESYEEWKNSVK